MIYPKDYNSIIGVAISLFALFIVFFGYIQAEIFTQTYKNEFDIKTLCKTDSNWDWKDFKIIQYEKYKRNAKIYCLYQNMDKTLVINLYYTPDQNQWIVEYARNLKDENKFQWPIYY
jgi:hypothetical protein